MKLVLSGTSRLVRSGTGESSDREPTWTPSTSISVGIRRLNLANRESFGFFLTLTCAAPPGATARISGRRIASLIGGGR